MLKNAMTNEFTNPPKGRACKPPCSVTKPLCTAAVCFLIILSVPASADLTFEPNHGQMDASVQFVTRGRGYQMYFTAGEVVLALTPRSNPAVMRLALVGGAPAPRIEGVEMLAARSHYIHGNDPSAWVTNVPHFRRVAYRDVYPNIDAVFYGNDGELEYDFTIRPGGDPGLIGFQTEAELRLDLYGDLLMRQQGEEVRWRRPIAYQEIDGERRSVKVAYRLAGQMIRFSVSAYDPRYTLVIDPVLKYSTYHGGSAADRANDVAVDKDGFIYVVGETSGSGFPLTAAAQTTYGGNKDGFVSKFNRNGSELIYSTYLGGSAADDAGAIDVDASGAAYVIGSTESANFPTTAGAYRTTRPENRPNVFVTKLSPQGTPVYSTYVGPYGRWTSEEGRPDISVDKHGYAYFTTRGYMSYPATPTPTSVQTSHDVVVTKLNQTGTALSYSLRIHAHLTDPNGNGVYDDWGTAIRVDQDGYAYVAGTTLSDNFPGVAGGYQSTPGGTDFPTIATNHDAFVLKVNQAGTTTVAATYFGGAGDDDAFGLALDDDGNVYVGGSTNSTNIATTANAFRTSGNGFMVKFNPSLSSASYVTYFPASVTALGIHEGHVYVAGRTSSATFPTQDAHQATLAGGTDGYLAVLNRTGTNSTYSTYFGGAGEDIIRGLYVDTAANAYFVGQTTSANFPTLTARQAAAGGAADAFLSIISFDADGDGLLDRWEESGIDVNEDGTVDLNLPALGANRNHKDLFLEIDYMADANHTHHPDRSPVNGTLSVTAPTAALIAAFAAAPVTNPDGNDGITLHVEVDEALSHQTPITLFGANSDFNQIKHGVPANPCGTTAHFARPADRTSTNCQHIVAARRRVYRYAIFGHDHAHVIGSSGVAELPGNDFVVSMASGDPSTTNDFDDNARQRALTFGTTFDAEWADAVAGTLMHELGHTLGLQHGGGTAIADFASREIQNKPNYLSVMNYSFQFNHSARDMANPQVLTRTNRPLDYSSASLPALNESVLNENLGVQGPAGARTIFRLGTAGYNVRIAPAQGPIDWNGQNGLEANVAVDLNVLTPAAPASPGEMLVGHDDWSNLIYNFRAAPDYVDGADFETISATPEPTSEEIGVRPPSCTVTSPTAGQVIAGPTDITIVASAITGEAALSRVEFYNGSTKLGEDQSSPYSFVWANVAAGSYQLSARVIDELGLVGTSNEVNLVVACAPAISQLSPGQTITFGSSVSLSVVASGNGLEYQWYRGSVGTTTDPVGGASSATLNVTPGGTTTYWVRVSNTCGSTDSAQIVISVIPGAVGPMVAVRSGAAVALHWGAAGGSASYEIERQDSASPFHVIGTTSASTTTFNDAGCAHTCVYRVRALDHSGTYASSFSNHDPATAGITPVTAGQRIAAAHMDQLLTSVNGLRQAAGANTVTWSGIVAPGVPAPAAGVKIYAAHVQAIRAAIDGALQANGIVPRTYTVGTITAGMRIRAQDVREMQQQVE